LESNILQPTIDLAFPSFFIPAKESLEATFHTLEILLHDDLNTGFQRPILQNYGERLVHESFEFIGSYPVKRQFKQLPPFIGK
jgi:hypothetical protein